MSQIDAEVFTCPGCGSSQMQVVDSWPGKGVVKRRRGCLKCEGRITTYEIRGARYSELLKMERTMAMIGEVLSKMEYQQPALNDREFKLDGNGEAKKGHISAAAEVLDFLNTKTSRQFQARAPNGQMTKNAQDVIARLKDGWSVQQCIRVIVNRCEAWQNDDRMRGHLTPQTIFRKSNFEKYVGELSDG